MADILSDDELRAAYASPIAGGDTTPISGLRAVERAVLSRLAEMGGETPPCDVVSEHIDGYSEDAMHAHYARGVAAGIAQERARCVAACDGLAEQGVVTSSVLFAGGWASALHAAEQAISKSENDEEELT